MERLRVATVKIGSLETEGVMFPSGSFGIAFPQAYLLLSVPQKHGAKTLKDTLGKELTVPQKHPTELNSQKVNILTLEEFERLLAKADRAYS